LVAGLTFVVGVPSPVAAPAVRRQEWWIGQLDLSTVWQRSTGAGVRVAVLDSGVDSSVGDLRGAVTTGFDASGRPGDGRTDTDPGRHGTSMAALIAGRGRTPGIVGTAPGATILPVALGEPSPAATERALARLTASALPPQVVNMSFAGASSCPAGLRRAVRAAVNRGLILVAAAGNQGALGNPPQAPADCPGVLAVAASDRAGSPSHLGSSGSYIALAAPGVDAVGYTSALKVRGLDGSSASAAIVSGVVADLRAAFPWMPSRQLIARLLSTATPGDPGVPAARGQRNVVFGFGIVSAAAALTTDVPADAPNAVYAPLGPSAGATVPVPGASAADASQAPPGSGAASRAPPEPAAAPDRSGWSALDLLGVLAGCLGIVLLVLAVVRTRISPRGRGRR